MIAAKEKTFSTLPDSAGSRSSSYCSIHAAATASPNTNERSKKHQPTTTAERSSPVNRITNYDFLARKFCKPHYAVPEKNRVIVPAESHQPTRKNTRSKRIAARELQWTPEMSQYRAYFVPGRVDPSGTLVETDEEKRRRLEEEWKEQNKKWKPVVDGGPRIKRTEQSWAAEWSSFFSSGQASGVHRARAVIDDSYLAVAAEEFYRGVNDTWTQSSYQPGKHVMAHFYLSVSCNCIGEAKVNARDSDVMTAVGGIKDTIGEIGAAVGYSYVPNGRNITIAYSATAAWERTGRNLVFTPKVGVSSKGATVTISPSTSSTSLATALTPPLEGAISWTCVEDE